MTRVPTPSVSLLTALALSAAIASTFGLIGFTAATWQFWAFAIPLCLIAGWACAMLEPPQ